MALGNSNSHTNFPAAICLRRLYHRLTFLPLNVCFRPTFASAPNTTIMRIDTGNPTGRPPTLSGGNPNVPNPMAEPNGVWTAGVNFHPALAGQGNVNGLQPQYQPQYHNQGVLHGGQQPYVGYTPAHAANDNRIHGQVFFIKLYILSFAYLFMHANRYRSARPQCGTYRPRVGASSRD